MMTLVTGGAKRLGASICRTLAEQGHHLAIHYRSSRDEAEETAKECRARGVIAETIAGDFSTPSGVESFLSEYTRRFPATIHLVNNVGNFFVAPALETPLEVWQELFQTNLLTPMMLSQRLAQSLIYHQGSIVNIGMVGVEGCHASPYAAAYTALKGALLAATRSLAKELAPHQVTVNMVSPGILDNTVNPPKDPTKLPMERMGHTEEVARVVAFLLDIKSRYITGQNIEIAGGVGLY